MGATSIWHWIILLLIVVLLFGRGKISEVMGDVAKGIKSFKKGMSEDEAAQKPDEPAKAIDHAGKPAEVRPEGSKVG
jgi:sec-independent protein translocase protein TatA